MNISFPFLLYHHYSRHYEHYQQYHNHFTMIMWLLRKYAGYKNKTEWKQYLGTLFPQLWKLHNRVKQRKLRKEIKIVSSRLCCFEVVLSQLNSWKEWDPGCKLVRKPILGSKRLRFLDERNHYHQVHARLSR